MYRILTIGLLTTNLHNRSGIEVFAKPGWSCKNCLGSVERDKHGFRQIASISFCMLRPSVLEWRK